MQNKVLFVLHCCQFFVTLATPKLLSLDKIKLKTPFYLLLCSLIRNFASSKAIKRRE